MLLKSLLGELLHEAEGTRKLLQAIPDDILNWKPSEKNWTTAQLASHIAETYFWFDPTFNLDIFDMAEYKYDKGDVSKTSNIIAKFEENLNIAKNILENYPEEKLFENWKMIMGEKELFPLTPRVQVARGMLFNHLYHHRGELVVYLRSTGNKVPSLYGPTADDTF